MLGVLWLRRVSRKQSPSERRASLEDPLVSLWPVLGEAGTQPLHGRWLCPPTGSPGREPL